MPSDLPEEIICTIVELSSFKKIYFLSKKFHNMKSLTKFLLFKCNKKEQLNSNYQYLEWSGNQIDFSSMTNLKSLTLKCELSENFEKSLPKQLSELKIISQDFNQDIKNLPFTLTFFALFSIKFRKSLKNLPKNN